MIRYLNERRTRILSETNLIKENQDLKYKNNNYRKNSTNLKYNKISLNKTKKNNTPKNIITDLCCERRRKKYNIKEGNKSFNKTGINYRIDKNLMKKEEKVKAQIPFLIEVEKSKRNSSKQLNINNIKFL